MVFRTPSELTLYHISDRRFVKFTVPPYQNLKAALHIEPMGTAEKIAGFEKCDVSRTHWDLGEKRAVFWERVCEVDWGREAYHGDLREKKLRAGATFSRGAKSGRKPERKRAGWIVITPVGLDAEISRYDARLVYIYGQFEKIASVREDVVKANA